MQDSLHKGLFLHTQKNAGTSVQVMARWAYGNENVVSHADHQRIGLEGCRGKLFVSGHFGIEFAKPLMPGRYCFTFLRDPDERLLSLYSYYRSRPRAESPLNEAAHEMSIDDFLRLGLTGDEMFKDQLWNHQVWQLGYGRDAHLAGKQALLTTDIAPQELLSLAKKFLDWFDYVGFIETFDTDITSIFSEIGAANEPVRKVNTNDNRLRKNDVSKRTLEIMRELSTLDQELYTYAKDLRAR